jgi:5,5'-dehydrodivanillate O-demethylase oxygenase subunit
MGLERKLEFADLEAVGPGTPSGRYLRLFWHPVMRARDLAPGRMKPIEILGEKFTVYRGVGGEAHLVGFRCAHRGTQLSIGWVEGDDIRCRYHGWKFDHTGQCNEQPNEERPFCQRIKIPAYPTREYAGLIFAFLGEGEPPKFRRYPDLEPEGVIVADPVEVIPCSFWNRIDNDLAHIAWVHRATAIRQGRNDYMMLRREQVTETEYGYVSERSVVGDTADFRVMSRTSHFFMPNVLQFAHRTRAKGYERRNLWDTKLTWTVPVNDRTFAAFDVTHTPLQGEEARAYAASRLEQQEEEADTRWDVAEKILTGDMMIEDIPAELTGYTSFAIEDYVTQVGQGPIEGRGRDHLGQTDFNVNLVRRLWLQDVSAVLEGRSPTPWKLPTKPIQVISEAAE